MDSSENKQDLYINGKKMDIPLDRLIAIIKSIKKNLPEALESVEYGDDLTEMDDLLGQLDNL